MPSKTCIEKFKTIGGPLAVVSAATEIFAKHGNTVTFHDPLASAVIFKPEICQYEEGQVSVDTKSDLVPGMTAFNTKAEQKPHRVAVDVNPEMFFEHYFSVTSGA